MSGIDLRVARIKKGLNQRQLVKVSGVGLTSISKIEKYGIENVTVSTLRKLAQALDTSVQELFFSEED